MQGHWDCASSLRPFTLFVVQLLFQRELKAFPLFSCVVLFVLVFFWRPAFRCDARMLPQGSRWRLHSVGPTSMGLSSLGQNIIHSPVARVVHGWWALAYKLRRMPGSTENVPHRAIWHLRGIVDKNGSFSLLSHTFGLIWLYNVLYSSIHIGSNP